MPASAFRRSPSYGSLNLAPAVQVIAYDWRLALGGFAGAAADASMPGAADAAAVDGMLAHWERALVDIGFLDPAAPKKLHAAAEPAGQPRAA